MIPVLGETYLISYTDLNYPCDCECHSNPNILHIMACCHDKSYYGPAKCAGTNYYPSYHTFFRPDVGGLWLFHENNILGIYNGKCPW